MIDHTAGNFNHADVYCDEPGCEVWARFNGSWQQVIAQMKEQNWWIVKMGEIWNHFCPKHNERMK